MSDGSWFVDDNRIRHRTNGALFSSAQHGVKAVYIMICMPIYVTLCY